MTHTLSFTHGVPIAAVVGGPLNNSIVRIADASAVPKKEALAEDVYDIMMDPDFELSHEQLQMLSPTDLYKLKCALERQADLDLDDRYMRGSRRRRKQSHISTEITLDDGVMVVLPSLETERVYIAGKSGVGKSTWAAFYMNEYLRMFPQRRVVLISRHEGDKAYANVEHKVLPISIFEKPAKVPKKKGVEPEEPPIPVALDELRDSLVVLDDCDNLPDKWMAASVKRLNDDIISNGRKFNIHTLTLAHHMMDYQKTRNLLMEANKIVWFPSGVTHHTTRFLKDYAGLDPGQIKKALSLKSRWVMLSMNVPSYIVHEHGAYLVNAPCDEDDY